MKIASALARGGECDRRDFLSLPRPPESDLDLRLSREPDRFLRFGLCDGDLRLFGLADGDRRLFGEALGEARLFGDFDLDRSSDRLRGDLETSRDLESRDRFFPLLPLDLESDRDLDRDRAISFFGESLNSPKV